MGMRHLLPLLLFFGIVFSGCVPLDYYDKAEISSISMAPMGTNDVGSINYSVSLFATINGHNVPVKDATIFIQSFNASGFMDKPWSPCRTITDASGTANFLATKEMMNKTTFVAVFCYSDPTLACAIDNCLIAFNDNGDISYKPSYASPNGIRMASYSDIHVCGGAPDVSDPSWGQKAKVFNPGTSRWDPVNLFLSSSMVMVRSSGTRVLSQDQIAICMPIAVLLGLLIASMFYMGVNPFFWFSMDRTQRVYIKPDTKAIQSSLTSGMSQHQSILTSVVNKTAGIYNATSGVSTATGKLGGQEGKLKSKFDSIKPGEKKGLAKVMSTIGKGFVGTALITSRVANVVSKATGFIPGMADKGVGLAAKGQAKLVAPVQMKAGILSSASKKVALTKGSVVGKAFGKSVMSSAIQSASGIKMSAGRVLGSIGMMVAGSALYLILRTAGLSVANPSAMTKAYVNKEVNGILKTMEDKKLNPVHVAALNTLISIYTKPVKEGGLGMNILDAKAKAQKDVDQFMDRYSGLNAKIGQLEKRIANEKAKGRGDTKEVKDMQKQVDSLKAELNALCQNTLHFSSGALADKAAVFNVQLTEIGESMKLARSYGLELGNLVSMKALSMYMEGNGAEGKILLDTFNSVVTMGAPSVDAIASIIQYFPPDQRESIAKSVTSISLSLEKLVNSVRMAKGIPEDDKSKLEDAIKTALNSGSKRESEKAMNAIKEVLEKSGSPQAKELLDNIQTTFNAKEALVAKVSHSEAFGVASVKSVLAKMGQDMSETNIMEMRNNVALLNLRSFSEAEKVSTAIKALQDKGYDVSYNTATGSLEIGKGGKPLSEDRQENARLTAHVIKNIERTRDQNGNHIEVPSSIPQIVVDRLKLDQGTPTAKPGVVSISKENLQSANNELSSARKDIVSNTITFMKEKDALANKYIEVLNKMNMLDGAVGRIGLEVMGFDKDGTIVMQDKAGNVVSIDKALGMARGTPVESIIASSAALSENASVANLMGEPKGGEIHGVNEVRDSLIVQINASAQRRESAAGVLHSISGSMTQNDYNAHMDLYSKFSKVDRESPYSIQFKDGKIALVDSHGNDAPDQQNLLHKFDFDDKALAKLSDSQKQIITEIAKENKGSVSVSGLLEHANASASKTVEQERGAREGVASLLSSAAGGGDPSKMKLTLSPEGKFGIVGADGKEALVSSGGKMVPLSEAATAFSEGQKDFLKDLYRNEVSVSFEPGTGKRVREEPALGSVVKDAASNAPNAPNPIYRDVGGSFSIAMENISHSMVNSSNLMYSMTQSVESSIFSSIVGVSSQGAHINSIYKDYADVGRMGSKTREEVFSAQQDYMDYMNSSNVMNPELSWGKNSQGLIPYLLDNFERKTAEKAEAEQPEEGKANVRGLSLKMPKMPEMPAYEPEPHVAYKIKSGDSLWEINKHAIEAFFPKFSEMSNKDQTKTLVAMEGYIKKEHRESEFGLQESREGTPGYREMQARSSGRGGLYRETHGLEAGTTLTLRKSVYEDALKVALPEALKSNLGLQAGGTAITVAEKPVQVTAEPKTVAKGPAAGAGGVPAPSLTTQKKPEAVEPKFTAGGPEKPPKKKPPT
jgi:hypothetical protein